MGGIGIDFKWSQGCRDIAVDVSVPQPPTSTGYPERPTIFMCRRQWPKRKGRKFKSIPGKKANKHNAVGGGHLHCRLCSGGLKQWTNNFFWKKKKIVRRFLSFKKKERRRVEYPAELVNSWNWYITGETYCPGSEMLEKKQVRTVMVCIEIMRLKWLKRHSGKSKESGQYSNWAATGKDGGCRAATWRNPSEMIELWWLLL